MTQTLKTVQGPIMTQSSPFPSDGRLTFSVPDPSIASRQMDVKDPRFYRLATFPHPLSPKLTIEHKNAYHIN